MRLSTTTAGFALAAALTAPLGAPSTATAAPGFGTPGTTTPVESPAEHHAKQPAKAGKQKHSRLSFGERTVRVAANYQGVPYRSGGSSPRGFDCSGFTRYVFAKLHKKLPRSSQQQYNAADRVRVPRVGDLIFYHSGRGGSVYHVAIYAGHGRVWHATRPGERVSKTKIYTRYWTAGRY